MTHLKIEQNNGVIEEVGSNLIKTLYDIAIGGLDNTSNLQGRLHVINSYRKYITKLTTDYSNLYIASDNYYMAFDDLAVESVFANGDYGDGIGITEANANRITKLSQTSGFRNNTSIEHFDELSQFVNLKTIDSYTFQGCSNLKTIDLSNITSLGTNVFKGCSLISIDHFPELNEVPNSTFADNTTLEIVELPSTITRLGDVCFAGCSNLTSIGDTSNVTIYGDKCLRNCSSLNVSLDLSDVTWLGNYCFDGCQNINITKLPQNQCTFGVSMFSNSGIKSAQIPTWMTSVPNDFLNSCKKLETVTFAQNSQVTSIERNFVSDCPLVQQIVLPEGVQTIGEKLGSNCSSLTLIDLPSTVTSIGQYSSSGNVTTFICRAITPPTLTRAIIINGNGKIYVPDQSIADYKAASNWSTHSSKIVGISQL